MNSPIGMIAKAVAKAVEAALKEDTPAEREKKRLEKEEEDRKLQRLNEQKVSDASAQAKASGLDVEQINRELDKISKDYSNIEVVIQKIKRIVERPGNEALKEYFSEEMEELTKRSAKRNPGAPEDNVTETSEEFRTRNVEMIKALDSLKTKVGEILGKSFFTRKNLEKHEERIEEVLEHDRLSLHGSKLPLQTVTQLDQVRGAIAEMHRSEEKMKGVQNLSSKTQDEQRSIEKEEVTV